MFRRSASRAVQRATAGSVPGLAVVAVLAMGGCGPADSQGAQSGAGSSADEAPATTQPAEASDPFAGWGYVAYEDRDPDATTPLTRSEYTGPDADEIYELQRQAGKQAGCRYSITRGKVDSEKTLWRYWVETSECILRAGSAEQNRSTQKSVCNALTTNNDGRYAEFQQATEMDKVGQYASREVFDLWAKKYCQIEIP